MKIGVLMGGVSTERDVSLNTGKAMLVALENLGYQSTSIILNDSVREIIPQLNRVDGVLIALHGGDGENGVIQGLLDLLHIPYSGSGPHASSICMDKHISKVIAEYNGLKTPPWVQISKNEVPKQLPFGFPVVVKPVDQGSTVGLSVVDSHDGLNHGLDTAFAYSDLVMIEKFIAGRELTVTILGEKAYPIVEIIPSHELYDYECKYSKGLSEYVSPAKLPDTLTQEIQLASEKIFELLKCRHYGRADYRLDTKGNFWFLEMNTLPGMTETSLVPKSVQAAGMSFEQLIQFLVENSIQ